MITINVNLSSSTLQCCDLGSIRWVLHVWPHSMYSEVFGPTFRFAAPLWMPVHTLMLPQHSPDLLVRIPCASSLHLYKISPDISAVLRYADVSGHSSVVYMLFQMLHASHVPDMSRWPPSLLASLCALAHFYQVSTGAPRNVHLPLMSAQYSSSTHAALGSQ